MAWENPNSGSGQPPDSGRWVIATGKTLTVTDTITLAGTGSYDLSTLSGVDLTTSQTVTGQKTFVAPVLGAATATSINGITITGSGTLLMAAYINTSVNSNGSGTISTNDTGGSISTSSHGGSISTSHNGGHIYTMFGGGSIDTRGTGSIELGEGQPGTSSNTMTTFTGSASGGNKSIALPNLSGTVALLSDTTLPLVASFF